MYYSPLRYPGGKGKIAPYISKICIENDIRDSYIEPYAGGAGVALDLLFNDIVRHIHINDADRSLYAFWYCMVNHPEVFMQVIYDTPIDLPTWEYYRSVQQRKNTCDIFELAVSTFFLNRTNRSGILNGGVIGGIEQKGVYNISCRFNKKNLLSRMELIASKRDFITVTNLDALDLIEQQRNLGENKGKLAYFDPPYYFKAQSLYMNHYQPEDHLLVASAIQSINEFHYIVSYDDVAEIRNLYPKLRNNRYSFSHTIINKRKGNEILFFDPKLKVEHFEDKNPVLFKRKRHSNGDQISYVGN